MRRLSALVLFTLGYAGMALFSPAAAAAPAIVLFAVAGGLLVTRPEPPRDAAEVVARELLRRR